MPAPDEPNILVIWGDDIGIWNLSCDSRGMMGYRTPGIDVGLEADAPTIAELLKAQGYATGR